MILLDATVNGKPAVLLLDTGANRTALSAEIAGANTRDALEATHRGLYLTRNVDLRVAECRWANWPALIVDMSQRSHMRIDGLLGEDVLREFSAVRIDYRNHAVELEWKEEIHRSDLNSPPK